MQQPSQTHRRPFGGGTYVAVDPFRPSVSLGIKNIISGQDDPTIDDIPVTRPQTQPYTVPYETQPYNQAGAYPIPYSQPVYATQPYSQPIYPVYSAPPHIQPIYQTQPGAHTQPGFPTQFQPYPSQPHPQPMQPTIIMQPPAQVPRGVPVIVPGHRRRSRSWRTWRHSSRSSRAHRAGSRSESRRSPRSPSPTSHSRSPKRRRSISQTSRRYSRSPERRSPSRISHQREPRKRHAPAATHVPRPRAHRRGSGEGGSTHSKARGRPRSPKPVGPIQRPGYKEKSGEGSSSGFTQAMSSVVPSVRSHGSRSPSHSLATPSNPPASPPHSPSPPRDQRHLPRVSPTSPLHSPTSPRYSPTSPLYHPASPHDSSIPVNEGQIQASQAESIPPTSPSSSGSLRRYRPQPVVVIPPQAAVRPQPVIGVPPIVIIPRPPTMQQSRSRSPSMRRSVSSRSYLRERGPVVVIPEPISWRERSRSRSPIYHRRQSLSSSRYRGTSGHSRSRSRERSRPFHSPRRRSPPRRYSPRRRHSPPSRRSPPRTYSPPYRHSPPSRRSPPRTYSPPRRPSPPRRRSPRGGYAHSHAAPAIVVPPGTPPTPRLQLPAIVGGDDVRSGYPPPVVIIPGSPSRRRPSRRPRSSSSRRSRRYNDAPEYSSSLSRDGSMRSRHRRRPRTPDFRPSMPDYATWDGYQPQPHVVPYPYRPTQDENGYVQYAIHARITAYAAAFLFDTIPRQIYLHFMLRLPSLYFRRVTRIFEEAEMSMPEIKKMALEAASEWKDPMRDLNRGFIFEPQVMTPPYASLQSSWQTFIDSLMREWKTLNVISVLLLSAILTILQINAAAADPYTRYSALLSLVCALMSLLYGCLYIIRFGTMRKTYKAAEWATEAQKSRTSILWNVWVMLAMPATWLAWSMILYLFCIMSFVWRTGTTDDANIRSISPQDAFWPRIAITVVFSLGLIYFLLVVTTFRRYGEMMDRAWQQRIWGWAQEKFGYEYLPPVYPTSYPAEPQTPVPYGSSAEYPHQPASLQAYIASVSSNPGRPPSHVSPRLTRDLARSRTPHSGRSLLPEVAIPPQSSSLLQTSPNRLRSLSISPPRLGGLGPSPIAVRSGPKSRSRSRERRLSPILAHIGSSPFSHSRSRSISPTRVRSRSSSSAQPPPGMAEGVQSFKVLSISSEGVFGWSKPDELVSRAVDDADWTRFNQESTAAWNDELDTLENPERFPPGFDLPQDRLSQVLDWWNTSFFGERGVKAFLDQEHTDGSPATFVVCLLINGPLNVGQSLADIATHFRELPEGLDRIDSSRPNENPKLEPPDV